MKFILMVALVFSLMSIGSSMLKSQGSQADNGQYSNTPPANGQHVLADYCCESLKAEGYFTKMPSLKKLCPRRFYCFDRFSEHSCIHIETSKECDTETGVKYCQYTCNKCNQCNRNKPLGMESGAIPDSSITASTVYSSTYKPPSARLNGKSNIGYGWCPKTNAKEDWIQVDLGKSTEVTAVATQGTNTGSYWVKSYSLQYSNNGATFTDYQGGRVFKANSDYNTVVKNEIKPAIHARYIRLIPKTYHSYKTMRMELYGCN